MNERFQRHYQATGEVAAAPVELFSHLDDPARLSSHMNERSMAMMGSRMSLSTDARGGREIGSVIRMAGRVLGIPLALEEAVVLRDPPVQKAWETLGQPRLLVIGAYRMGFRIAARGPGSQLTVFIDYDLPRGASRWLGRLFGGAYATWCCQRMLGDAQAAFKASPSPLQESR
jgi:hypothetical protein